MPFDLRFGIWRIKCKLSPLCFIVDVLCLYGSALFCQFLRNKLGRKLERCFYLDKFYPVTSLGIQVLLNLYPFLLSRTSVAISLFLIL